MTGKWWKPCYLRLPIVKMSNQAEGIVVLQTEDPKCPVVLDFHSGESEKKYNLMLQKDISILQII